ncbi:MAG: hypothetical protein HY917_04265, partial [Candidatus Diapherotrites archaeon]|nr:hypothetical protein [Candidatus Diapherotrites archaeon]
MNYAQAVSFVNAQGIHYSGFNVHKTEKMIKTLGIRFPKSTLIHVAGSNG